MNKVNIKNTLMKNQKAALLIPKQSKFQTFQLTDGTTLFISIDESFTLQVMKETKESDTGWSIKDISSILEKKHNGESIKVKSFDSVQYFNTDSKSYETAIAIVVRPNGENQDYLYINYSIETLFENDNLKEEEKEKKVLESWDSYPFNDSSVSNNIDITNIYIVPKYKVNQNNQLVCGVKTHNGYIQNYIIDEKKQWHKFVTPKDFDKVLSETVGKAKISREQGLYQLIQNGNSKTIVFTPATKRVPIPINIKVPQNASKIVTIAESDTNPNTHLFISSSDGIYLVTSEHQHKNGEYTKIIDGSFKEFNVYRSSDIYTIFAKTEKGEGVYFKAEAKSIENKESWSESLPIIKDINQISFYTDREKNNITLFAQKNDGNIIKLHQNSLTTMWSKRDIMLPTESTDKVIEYVAHSSLIHIKDKENKEVPFSEVKITASSECEVYINGLYYKLSPSTPTIVKTDVQSSLNIEQLAENIDAISYSIQIENEPKILISPTKELLEKLSKVKNGDDLRKITIEDEQGNKKHLVDESIPQKNVDEVAKSIRKFVEESKKFPQDGTVVNVSAVAKQDRKRVQSGDFFSYLTNVVTDVASFALEVVEGVVTAVVTIAGKIFEFVVKCISDIVNAILAILETIKVVFEKVIQWIGFIFSWNDILYTKDAIKGLIKLQVKGVMASMDDLQSNIKSGFKDIKKFIDELADLPEIEERVDDVSSQAQSQNKGFNTPEAQYGVNHFKKGATSVQMKEVAIQKIDDKTKGIFDRLKELEKDMEGIANEVKIAIERIKSEVIDNFGKKSIGTILKKLLGIVGRLAVGAVEGIIMILFDIVKIVITSVMEVMDMPIYIPVLSWLYRSLTGSELSVLDLLSLIAAIPATITYKIVSGKAPFTEKSIKELQNVDTLQLPTNQLSNNTHSNDIKSIKSIRRVRSTRAVANIQSNSALPVSESIDSTIRTMLFTTYVVSSIGTTISIILDGIKGTVDILAGGLISASTGFSVLDCIATAFIHAPTGFEIASKYLKGTLPFLQTYWISNIPSAISNLKFTFTLLSFGVSQIFCILKKHTSFVASAQIIPFEALKTSIISVLTAFSFIPLIYKTSYEIITGERNRVMVIIDTLGETTHKISTILGFGNIYVYTHPLLLVKIGFAGVSSGTKVAQGIARFTVERL